jgi:hypothetical protein
MRGEDRAERTFCQILQTDEIRGEGSLLVTLYKIISVCEGPYFK